jgi:hypothetical protein
MKIRDYKKYFDTTTDDLASEELKHLVNYFSLLGQVESPLPLGNPCILPNKLC